MDRGSERPWAESPTHEQPYLAAFDLYTNNWVPTFTPTLDDAVWALAVHDGKLFVGGEFDTVNGVAHEGLVELDPETGAIISSFATHIDNVGTSYEGSVRALEVVDDVLYVVGDFNRIVEPPWSHGVYRIGRMNAITGVVDTGWLPRATGGGIFDIAVDAGRGKAIIVGTFTSVNASPSTLSGAVVNLTDGATAADHPMSTNGNHDSTWGVAILGDRYWLAGKQNFMQVRDADDWSYLGCVSSGNRQGPECNERVSLPGADGGDYQYAEDIDGYVVAGCHCPNYQWNTFTGETIDLEERAGTRIYRPDGTDFDWSANMTFWTEAAYAAFGDTNGCLYLGGDFTGNVDGFGRMCPVLAPDNLVAITAVGSITVSWDEPDVVGSGVDHYEVSRSGVVLGTVTGTAIVDGTVAEKQLYSYTVLAVSESGTRGSESTPLIVVAAGGDPPVVDPVADQSDPIGTAVVGLTIVASDPDSGDVTFAANGLPSGLTMNETTGVITRTPDTIEDVTVTVTVTDDEDTTTPVTFEWSVFEPAPRRSCPTEVPPFVDVSPSSFALADIACLYGLGITKGTSATTFGAAGLVTREQMAAFVARTLRDLGIVCPADPLPFIDVPLTSFAHADVQCIFGLGITTGTSSNTYSPADLVTREQMASFIARAYSLLAGAVCPTPGIPFTDVFFSSFAYWDVRCIFGLGITTGTSSITYSPAELVNRAQMSAFVARLWRLAISEGIAA